MPSKFEILRQPDKEAAAAEAGEYLNSLLLENKAQPALLLVSAGSSLALLNFVGFNVLGPNLTVCVIDERFSTDPATNNFAQLQKTDFYKDALDSDVSFFGTLPRPEDTAESLANRWEHNLRKWRTENPFGKIFATLGMGPDGHTAGIFPFADDANEFHKLFEGQAWIRAYSVNDKNIHKERITATLTFFKEIDAALGFISGNEKASRFDRLIKKQGEVFELPALAWHRIPSVKLFTNLQ